MAEFLLSDLAIKTIMPTNRVMTDDKGLPSIMVRVPKFKISDVTCINLTSPTRKA